MTPKPASATSLPPADLRTSISQNKGSQGYSSSGAPRSHRALDRTPGSFDTVTSMLGIKYYSKKQGDISICDKISVVHVQTVKKKKKKKKKSQLSTEAKYKEAIGACRWGRGHPSGGGGLVVCKFSCSCPTTFHSSLWAPAKTFL